MYNKGVLFNKQETKKRKITAYVEQSRVVSTIFYIRSRQ